MIKFDLLQLLTIAKEAKMLCELDNSIRILKGKYHDKLNEWVGDRSYQIFDRDSEEWEEAMLYAKTEREAYQRARKDRYNTMRRLRTATKKVNL